MRADYNAPEEAMAAIQKQRTTRLILVVAGIVAAVVAMIAASALMYSDDNYHPHPVKTR
jgi:hypothetical protein